MTPSSIPVPEQKVRAVRVDNERRILTAMLERGQVSRAELADYTGLSRTTVFEVVAELLRQELVVQVALAAAPKTRGRPSTKVALNLRTTLVAGVDIGRRHTRVVLVNAAYEVVGEGIEPAASGSGDLVSRAEQTIRLIRKTASDNDVQLGTIRSVGVGLSGIVNVVVPQSDVSAFQSRLAEELSVTVAVANNSRLAALAEATWGAARGSENALYIRWSSGIGSGSVVRGQLLQGAHGAAGEIGHISVDPEAGRPCYCGSRGCIEMYAGIDALLSDCANAGVVLGDESELLAEARAGNTVVLDLIGHASSLLGRVVAACSVQLDPELVVVGGDIANLGEIALAPIRQAIREQALPNSPREVRVVPGALDSSVAARGAVALVMPSIGL
ncbi:ROK family protein [Lysinimonas soli]|uniref:ROK family protein n=1 Tax=Lysinimonas soli TaxID=1074233 RepID=A0ABW0NR04_9MICO